MNGVWNEQLQRGPNQMLSTIKTAEYAIKEQRSVRLCSINKIAMAEQCGGNSDCRSVDRGHDRFGEMDESMHEPNQQVCMAAKAREERRNG